MENIESPYTAFIDRVLNECPKIGVSEDGYDLYKDKDGLIVKLKKGSINGMTYYICGNVFF